MIGAIRLFIAVALFCLGLYLTVDLFISGFSLFVLIAAIVCFVLAHYVKPKGRSVDDLASAFDFIIDIPFRAIAGFLRVISKPFKGEIDGIDF
ncbi:hypothetical protein [Stutzerimonas stutzeri]|uniref:hypothetical protein n=1 Tax=Stutzerimonas stutzeri TaxID=316 RepID=UPI00035FF146|nr:hypothetical protein [Stutzerimonas stutzeri]